MINATLRTLSENLAHKTISSVELTEMFLKRIDDLNPILNAFIALDKEKTQQAAKSADLRLSKGQQHALTGIPIAIKDLFCHQGWKTTCCSKILKNFVSPYSAHVVEQCQNVGMVILGHTNMDEFAMGSSNEYSCYGPVKNPWHVDCTPGGSSGGSAASVAARLAPVALGTDTGGSIRQPASFCGITSIKPTYGMVSRFGMVAFASSLDQCGPMAKTAEDCALLLNILAGFDERDATSILRAKEDYTRNLNASIEGLRIGLPKEYFSNALDTQVASLIKKTVAILNQLGAKTVDVSLPNIDLSIPAYYVIAPAEASANLARYDGIRFGHRAHDYEDLTELYEKSRAEGFGKEVKQRILIGTYVLSHGYYDAYYLKAQKIRRLIAEDFQQAFKVCDVIAAPVTPTTAFRLGEKQNDPIQMYLSDMYTIAVNLAGLPGMSVPSGFTDEAMPAGIQLIGSYFSESRLLNVAHRLQQVTDWHHRMPHL
ncbi:MAG: Asp-tRNA(Asn)/Glu-tRNA(Gln) amidotransferase subunit GatA [Neisseriales bacterium]|nr:MAG: Asp-tRNA(Asn)/Glu-tRNA(Gln) amidotransferase subunit GatA [Neisseriales bacterium]